MGEPGGGLAVMAMYTGERERGRGREGERERGREGEDVDEGRDMREAAI